MDFIGSGRRLKQGDVGAAARELGVETAVLLAFLEVEARGRGFDSKKRPKMLFEPHVMFRNTKGAIRNRAVAAGVAYKNWGAKRYPRDSYPRLSTAIGIDRNAGFLSASYGLAQILGENFRLAGFASAEAMFAAFKQGEREQLLGMVAFLKSTGIAKHLRGKDFTKPSSWIAAVSRYNGKGFRKNKYHIKCAAAYRKHAKRDLALPEGTILIKGLKGEAVRNLQADLVELGYDVGPVDGRFGGLTLTAVQAFQKSHGLKVDGKVGGKTQKAIKKALAAAEPQSPIPSEGQSGGLLSRLVSALINFFLNWRK